MRYLRRWAFVLMVVLGASQARAEAPAGIVMAINGDTDPKLTAMQEIPANTLVTLPAGTQLTFLHYARCKLITVSGGSVTLSRADYRSEGGKVESEKDGPCPKVFALAGSGDGHSTGGIVSRGVGGAPRWPVNPEFIFSGQRAGAVTAAQIFAEGKLDQPVMALKLAGWRASEPDDAPRMVADARYVLRLTMREASKSVDVPFIAIASTEPAPLVVVRVD